MAISTLARLSWAVGQKMHAGVARDLGVTRATVTRYLSGIRQIPQWRLSQIDRMYERTQYEVLRTRGLAPEAAARYRGLAPDTFDGWVDRLEDIKDKFAAGHTAARLRREQLDIEDLGPEGLQTIFDEEYDKLADTLDDTGSDIEELERYA